MMKVSLKSAGVKQRSSKKEEFQMMNVSALHSQVEAVH